jgi:hypothetical protein
VRTYGEVIDVRTAGPTDTGTGTGTGLGLGTPGFAATDGSGAPAQFLWRGRLYLVRDVLAHWVEIGAWWSLPRRTGGTTRRAGTGPVGVPTSPYAVELDAPVRSVAVDVGAVEREVWRVEAAAGRSATCGVYDLVRDVPAVDPAATRAGSARPAVPPPRWRLARTLD